MRYLATARLEPMSEARVALESVDIQASLRGLVSEVILTQTYRNLENANIEAVYTFPLPLDAVLLDLTVELGGKKLRGVVQPRTDAEKRYEDAIEDGDSALLLQNIEPGLFTVNMGNILPDERAVVQFRYSLLHRWQGDSLRLLLPTTIAPRYGNPTFAGLAEHQVPEYALTADHGFSLVIRVEGELAQTSFECPSHPIAVNMHNGIRELSLSGGSALMDRDFVLVIKEPTDLQIESIWERDHEDYVVLSTFHPVLPDDMPESPRCVKLVVDCSGSMGGDSIAQAKVALHEILSLLKPNDHFNLITFGSGFERLFPKPVAATERNIRTAARFIERMDASMGGTEIGAALDAAYNSGEVDGLPSDLLLITDGEVWNHDQVVSAAKTSGHRIFSVGVGSAVSEAFVRRIAESTRGACELVSPREKMSEHIVRHFKRIDQPRARSVRVEWPEAPVKQTPSTLETVYAGDTLHVFGWFKTVPEGNVGLVMTFEDGRVVTQQVPISKESCNDQSESACLPRVAAHEQLQSLVDDEAQAVELAKQYQLVTEYTSCVLVFDKGVDEKAEGIPALRKVPHVLAAGWGGMGAVEQYDMPRPAIRRRATPPSRMGAVEPKYNMPLESRDLEADLKGIDFFRPLQEKRDAEDRNIHASYLESEEINDFSLFIARLNALYSDRVPAQLNIETVSELLDIGLDQGVAEQLLEFVDEGYEELSIVVCFLVELSREEAGKGLSRHVIRLIHQANKKNVLPAALVEAVSVLID